MAQPKILVIDDDAMTCQLMETFLRMENFQTSSITHLEHNDIIALLEHEKPNALIMDFHLASHETLDFVVVIRANEQWNQLPVIMTSAIDYTRKCIEAGANDFIVKPFDWQAVVVRIREILGDSVFQEA